MTDDTTAQGAQAETARDDAALLAEERALTVDYGLKMLEHVAVLLKGAEIAESGIATCQRLGDEDRLATWKARCAEINRTIAEVTHRFTHSIPKEIQYELIPLLATHDRWHDDPAALTAPAPPAGSSTPAPAPRSR